MFLQIFIIKVLQLIQTAKNAQTLNKNVTELHPRSTHCQGNYIESKPIKLESIQDLSLKFSAWTNVAKTNVAWTNVTETVG